MALYCRKACQDERANGAGQKGGKLSLPHVLFRAAETAQIQTFVEFAGSLPAPQGRRGAAAGAPAAAPQAREAAAHAEPQLQQAAPAAEAPAGVMA